jgi:glc operon protein GlcG
MNRAAASSLLAAGALGVIAASISFAERPGGAVCALAGGAESINDSACVAVQHALTLEGATRALDAAVAFARERGAGGAIAVVDGGGHLVAFRRLDGTFAAGATVSIGKARSAAIFRKPTKAFEDAIREGRVSLTAVGELTPLQGGVPIVHEGQVIGGIGVSGARSQVEDEEIALAGAAAIAGSALSQSR